jgi:succinoglycan biosynthesis transport protein ExoP
MRNQKKRRVQSSRTRKDDPQQPDHSARGEIPSRHRDKKLDGPSDRSQESTPQSAPEEGIRHSGDRPTEANGTNPAPGQNGDHELESRKTRRGGKTRDIANGSAANSDREYDFEDSEDDYELPVARRHRKSDPGGASRARNVRGRDIHYYEDADEFRRDEPEIRGREITLPDLFYMVCERWMLGAGVGLLLSSFAAFYLLSKPQIYSAQADFQIDLSEDQVLGQESGIEKVRNANDLTYYNLEPELLAHEEKMASSAFLSMMAGKFDDPEDASSPKSGDFIEAYVKEFPEYRESEDGTPVTDAEIFASIFPSGLSVSREELAVTFNISYQHMDPEWAAKTANLLADSYQEFLHSQVESSNTAATDFLAEEAEAARLKFKESQRALMAFHAQNGRVFKTTEETASPEAERVTDLSQQITIFDIRLSELSVQIAQVDSAGGKVEDLLRLGFISEFENISLIEKNLEAKKLERNEFLAQGAGLRHPKMVENTESINTIIAELRGKVAQRVQTLKNEFAEVTNSRAAVNEQLANARSQLVETGQGEGDYLMLESQMEGDHLLLTTLEARLKQTGITSRLDTSSVHVINPAMVPVAPVSPNKRLVALASVGLFGMCLLGLPVALGLIDNRLKTVSEAESFLQVDCLGVVPLKKGKLIDTGFLAQAVAEKEDIELMEAFRAIYSAIRLKSEIDYPKKILVTSAVPGEGKSFVVTNLAFFFEQQGKSVLILDGDLRRPSQHRNFDLGNDAGIIQWFDSDAALSSKSNGLQHPALDIRQAEDAEVFLLRAGGADRNPTSIIETRRFAGIIESAASHFDVIIIDTPPVGVFPDALFLADYVDECVFVTKHRSIPRQKVKFALNKLQEANDCILGFVINQMDGSKAQGGYGYGYNDYGYGHGYNAKKYESYYAHKDD